MWFQRIKRTIKAIVILLLAIYYYGEYYLDSSFHKNFTLSVD